MYGEGEESFRGHRPLVEECDRGHRPLWRRAIWAPPLDGGERSGEAPLPEYAELDGFGGDAAGFRESERWPGLLGLPWSGQVISQSPHAGSQPQQVCISAPRCKAPARPRPLVGMGSARRPGAFENELWLGACPPAATAALGERAVSPLVPAATAAHGERAMPPAVAPNRGGDATAAAPQSPLSCCCCCWMERCQATH